MSTANQDATNLVNVLEGGLIKEELWDEITNVDDQEFIFLPRAGSGSTGNQQYSWGMDRFKAPVKTNKQIDGDDIDQLDNSEGQRVWNTVETAVKEVKVSTQADRSDVIDRANTLSEQLGKVGEELKRDQEHVLFGNQAAVLGTSTVAGEMGALESWIDGKVLIPALDGATTFTQTAARQDLSTGAAITGGGWEDRPGGAGSTLIGAWDYTGITPNAMTETSIKAAMEALFMNTGSRADRSLVMDVPTNTKTADFYFTSSARIATLTAETNQEGPARAMGAINSVLTNYGVLHLVPSNLKGYPDATAEGVGASSALILDWTQIETIYQDGMQSKPLGDTGLSRKILLWVIYGLRVKNSEALGIIQGIDNTADMLP